MPAVDHVRLTFAEQIAFFRAKLGNLVPTRTWTDLWEAEHDRAFVVAGVQKADMLADFFRAVELAIGDGTGIGEFRKSFDSIVAKYGWAHTGERNWRSRVIYQTNISTSYAAGRAVQLKESGFPYLMYKHSDSVMHPRELHESWDGLVLPARDPWWRTHTPPNGWGCKCRLIGIRNEAMARRMGGKWGAEAPDSGIDPSTGEPAGIDKGWGYAPGASVVDEARAAAAAKLDSLPAKIAAALRKDLSTLGRDDAAD